MLEQGKAIQVQMDRRIIMQHIFEAMGVPMCEVELTPLTARLLEQYRIPLLDAILCFVLPRLELPALGEVVEGHLAELTTPEPRLPQC